MAPIGPRGAPIGRRAPSARGRRYDELLRTTSGPAQALAGRRLVVTHNHPVALPVLRAVSVCTHAVTTTPAEPLGGVSLLLSGRWQPSLNLRHVGLRIALFEACSTFTHVAACTLDKSPEATLCTEDLGCFVAFATVPIADGWSDSYRADINFRLRATSFTAY